MVLELANHPGPLRPGDPGVDALLADLQGNILVGHGRDQARHLFLRFEPGRIAEARRVLAGLADGFITSAHAQLASSRRVTGRDGGLFAHVALTADGYRALGIGALPRGRAAADVFAAGMKERRLALQDPAIGAWDPGFQGAVHAVVIVASARPGEMVDAEEMVRSRFACDTGRSMARLLAVEPGRVLRRSMGGAPPVAVEHFGYADGLSQPVLLETGAAPSDPVAPPRLVLAPDPNGEAGSFGSFMVFRKLEQDVRGFRTAVAALAAELGCPPALVGAMAVGRFEDGTPVVARGSAIGSPTNDFDYRDDPLGRRCPFQAHIRKTNPRVQGASDRRIARRGIPYLPPAMERTFEADDLPERDVGLLFICYQADIGEQFEHQQRAWCNDAGPPVPAVAAYARGTGIDPVAGGGGGDPARTWPSRWGGAATRTRGSLASSVTLKGGDYFFAPSLSALRRLG